MSFYEHQTALIEALDLNREIDNTLFLQPLLSQLRIFQEQNGDIISIRLFTIIKARILDISRWIVENHPDRALGNGRPDPLTQTVDLSKFAMKTTSIRVREIDQEKLALQVFQSGIIFGNTDGLVIVFFYAKFIGLDAFGLFLNFDKLRFP